MTTLAAFIDRSRRDKEDWKYTDLESLLSVGLRQTKPRRPFLLQKEEGNIPRLVFLNGVFTPALSTFGAIPSCILMGDLESGYALTLGEQTCLVAQPIELLFEEDDNAPQELALRFSIDVGNSGRLSLLENHRPCSSLKTMEMNVVLHPNAKFVHGKIACGGALIAEHQVRLSTGCYYNNFTLLRGASPMRHEVSALLQGEGAQAVLNGVMLLRGKEHADTTTRITHEAPHCLSRQNYKTVLNDKARGVFQGRITVAKGAQKSDGRQLSHALLLSDQAEMDAKPELEIYADDVQCSHGSAIGDLDENMMFYLRSRGLDEARARALLVQGFVSELLEHIHIEDWREKFHREIEEATT